MSATTSTTRPCLEAVGLPVVPADAWPEVVPLARWVLERPGGHGCVRELCDARLARAQLSCAAHAVQRTILPMCELQTGSGSGRAGREHRVVRRRLGARARPGR